MLVGGVAVIITVSAAWMLKSVCRKEYFRAGVVLAQ
jgi:hypothetical protein